jgi:hypothetical protein
MAVVTLAEHDRVALLQQGDRLVLNLGDGFQWTLSVTGIEVLAPLANSALPPGVQAVFEAQEPGKALVRAAGEEVCRRTARQCSHTVIRFSLTVVVQ